MLRRWLGMLYFTFVCATASAGAPSGAAELVSLSVPGMTCSVCPITVRKALSGVPGVLDVQVDYDSKTAKVLVEPGRVQVQALMDATANAGYPSSLLSK